MRLFFISLCLLFSITASWSGPPPETIPTEQAQAWLRAQATAARQTAQLYGVDPVAVAAIVVTEIHRRAVLDDLEDSYIHTLLAEKDAAYFQRLTSALAGSSQPGEFSSLEMSLPRWSLGPAQIQLRLALEKEPSIAAGRKRPPRPLKEVLAALLDPLLCLDFVCAILRDIGRSYQEIAGLDISHDVGVLATVYNLGSPAAHARKLRNKESRSPGLNEMGRQAKAFAPYVRQILNNYITEPKP